MSDVVIDLGELPHDRQQQVRPASGARPPHPYRSLLAGLAVVLAAMLTGSVHRAAPTPPTVIPAGLGDTTFAARDRYFVVGSTGVRLGRSLRNRIIAEYELPSGRLLSRTSVVVTGAINHVTAAGGVILVSYQIDTVGAHDTVAIEPGTGQVRWRHPARVMTVSPDGGLVLLRAEVVAGQPAHWYGLDVRSGATRWAVDEPAAGFTTMAGDDESGFPSRLVTVTVGGHLETHDPWTGVRTAVTTIDAPTEWRLRGLNVAVVNDLVLIGGHRGITAYGLFDLSLRWHSPINFTEVFALPRCGDAICLFGPFGGMHVLDPATGVRRWGTARWALAERAGAYLLVSGNDRPEGQQPLVVLDPGSGRERGTLGPWQPVGRIRPDGTVVALRVQLGERRVWYALLDPASLGVRLLGKADSVSGDCQVTVQVLICRRVDASVGIWPLEPS